MKIKKSKLHIITLSVLLLLLSCCLCGCATVNFVTYHNIDGSIHEYVHLTIDEQAFSSHGYTTQQISEAKTEIANNSYLEASQLLDEYKIKLENEYSSSQLTSDEYTTLFNGITIIEQKWDNTNEYVIGLEFKNSTIYKKYYELLNGIQFTSKGKEVKKTFYTKTYYYGTTNYGDYSIFNRVYNYYANSRFATISPQEANLNYSYSVSSRRFHSDADEINIDANGNYIHTWKVDPNNPAREIYFYTISANRSMWIIVCVGLGLITTLILGIVGIVKTKKRRA